MGGLLSISRAIDAVTGKIGKYVAWMILAAVMISTVNAIVRKLFDVSSNAYLELQWVLFGAVFLLCSPWTLMNQEHIRIDIVNNLFPQWLKHAVDLLGHILFLMPFALIMTIDSWPFFQRSFAINEQSLNAGGLPQWPAKFLVVAGFFVLAVQGISEIIKRIAIITGDLEDYTHTAHGGGHGAAAEAEAQRLLDQAKADGIAPITATAQPSGTVAVHGVGSRS